MGENAPGRENGIGAQIDYKNIYKDINGLQRKNNGKCRKKGKEMQEEVPGSKQVYLQEKTKK